MVVILIIPFILIILNRRAIMPKLKLFLKNYKILIVLEILFIIILFIINIFNKTVVIKEKDPHSNEVLKATLIKQGETYEYITQKTKSVKNEENNSNNTLNTILKMGKDFMDTEDYNVNIVIKNVGIATLTIEKDGEEMEYKYGEGFSYQGINSCKCGTPIIFSKTTYDIFKAISISILVIDFIILCFVKENKTRKEKNKNV